MSFPSRPLLHVMQSSRHAPRTITRACVMGLEEIFSSTDRVGAVVGPPYCRTTSPDVSPFRCAYASRTGEERKEGKRQRLISLRAASGARDPPPSPPFPPLPMLLARHLMRVAEKSGPRVCSSVVAGTFVQRHRLTVRLNCRLGRQKKRPRKGNRWW